MDLLDRFVLDRLTLVTENEREFVLIVELKL